MLSWLRRLFSPPLDTKPETLRALQERVRLLESEQVTLLTEWEKTRGQVLRYMKRAAAMKPEPAPLPQLDLVEDDEDDEPDELDVLVSKLRGRRA